jgi:predicted phage terminase large subunit-like protein
LSSKSASPTWTEARRQAVYQTTITENKWLRHPPTAKQANFLRLADQAEILYGGAAGGGKSIGLLMGALQFVDVPGYAAILFRRTLTDLSLPGSLMDRANEWLGPTAATYSDARKTWTFPSGATLCFGYLDRGDDKYRYQSSEFQYIGFDELTQFPEADYLYLFSRLRRGATSQLPLRMRAATNPGGSGHQWVKKRFLSPEGQEAGRLFIPARLQDNPHLDREEYTRALGNLPAFERKQLLEGDWSEFEGTHFRPTGWPRYRVDQGAYVLGPRLIVPAEYLWVFATCDPATSAKAPADHTCILVAGVTPTGDVLILYVLRQRLDLAEIIPTLARVCREWAPLHFAGLESVAFQRLLVREAREHPGLPPIRELRPRGRGKLERALPAVVKGEGGKIFLPAEAPWLDDFILELTSFTGDGDACDDQVDALSYATEASQLRPTSAGGGPVLLTPGHSSPFGGGADSSPLLTPGYADACPFIRPPLPTAWPIPGDRGGGPVWP